MDTNTAITEIVDTLDTTERTALTKLIEGALSALPQATSPYDAALRVRLTEAVDVLIG